MNIQNGLLALSSESATARLRHVLSLLSSFFCANLATSTIGASTSKYANTSTPRIWKSATRREKARYCRHRLFWVCAASLDSNSLVPAGNIGDLLATRREQIAP